MGHYAVKPRPLLAKSVKYVAAKPSTSVTFECIICLNLFNTNESYHTPDCTHSSCRQCLRDYFNSLLKNTNLINFDTVNCPHPDCKKQFHTEQDLELIFKPEEIKEWWEAAYKITFMKNKVTCPFKDCGVSFEVEEDLLKECTFASCLVCRKGFCTVCQSTWHPGVMKIINEKEQLNKTLQVVKNNAWTRCPKCKRFVEKIDGCTSMLCVCGGSFCYRCGGLRKDHICLNNCHGFSKEMLEKTRKSMFEQSDK